MRKLISVLVLAMAAHAAAAAVPRSFSVQGVMRDGAGKLQSMMLNINVRFFDAQTMGTPLTGVYNAQVMAVNGLFTVTVTDAAIISKLQGAAEVWMEVQAGNDVFPRQQVTPEVYALMAATADDSAALGGVAAANWKPVAAVYHQMTGNPLSPGGPSPVPNMTVTVAAPGPGFIAASFSGFVIAGSNTISVDITDSPSGKTSSNGLSSGNMISLVGGSNTPAHLSWVVPVGAAGTHTIGLRYGCLSNVNCTISGDLMAVWYPGTLSEKP